MKSSRENCRKQVSHLMESKYLLWFGSICEVMYAYAKEDDGGLGAKKNLNIMYCTHTNGFVIKIILFVMAPAGRS